MSDPLPPVSEPVDEPDLHEVGPTPLADLGVPEGVTEEEWLEANK